MVSDPSLMLDEFKESISVRKLRLFAVACCRRIWGIMDETCRQGVEVAERYADGRAGIDELRIAAFSVQAEQRSEAKESAAQAVHASLYDPAIPECYIRRHEQPNSLIRFAYAESAIDSPWAFAKYASIHAAYAKAAAAINLTESRLAVVEAEYQAQAVLLREIVGEDNKFCP